MVEKGARTALHVFDVPLPARAPELAVSSADDLALKANRCRRGSVGRRCYSISLAIPTDSDNACRFLQGAGERGEAQRRTVGPAFDMRYEANGGKRFARQAAREARRWIRNSILIVVLRELKTIVSLTC